MRVRLKTEPNGGEYVVEDIGEWYYVGRMVGTNALLVLAKTEYEPTPEPQWVRIFGATFDEWDIMHPGYRLVPVQVEGRHHPLFYVERKVLC